MEAELLGVFVEDINLLRVASLPFARQIRYPSAIAEPLDAAAMERELRVKAEQARKALATAAERAQVRWSFRVLRGTVTAEVLAAASEADLLTLGKAGRSLTGRRLGSTALAAATNAPRALLFVQEGIPFGPPVLAVYDGSRGSRGALGAAIRLTHIVGDAMMVLILANAPDTARQLQEQAAQLIKGQSGQVRYRWIYSASDLVQVLTRERNGVLVLSGELIGEGLTQRLLQEVTNSLMLVGQ